MVGNEATCQANDVFGLLAKHSQSSNQRLDTSEFGRCELLGRGVGREERGRYQVHLHVGRLCAQYGGDDELKGRVVVELAMCVRMSGYERAIERKRALIAR